MEQNYSDTFIITEESFEDLYRKYYARLCRFAFYYVNSNELAEEIVQDIFTELWAKHQQLRIRTNIESYLYIAVKNHTFSKLKKRFRTQSIEKIEPAESELTNSFDEATFKKRLELVIITLPRKCKLIYNLKYSEGLTNREIARFLEISEKTVETQIYRALVKLRTQLAPFLSNFFTDAP